MHLAELSFLLNFTEWLWRPGPGERNTVTVWEPEPTGHRDVALHCGDSEL